jgi:DNA-directed RNA polymerase specialized sigma24 family protein
MSGKATGDRAIFLAALGLELDDIAAMIGSTPASVRELLRLAKNKSTKRGPKSNARKKRH